MKRTLPIALFGMAIVAAPLFGDQGAQPLRPGAVNYVEGNAFLDGTQLTSQSVVNAEMSAGQELTTEQCKAEILLTPGVFLRLGENNAVKMISPKLTPTQVEIDRGHAAFEVDEFHKENNREVTTAGVATHQVAEQYSGALGFTPGWYWNPYGYGYTFIGADPFYSPFGWGFYPPAWGGFYGGYWGSGYYVRPYRGFHGPVGHYENHGFRGGEIHGSGSFHAGVSGGFHGGAGVRSGRR